MPESLLPQFQRCPEAGHERWVRVPKDVETITAGNGDSEGFEQGPESSLENHVLIQWRSVFRSEHQPTFVRMPLIKMCPAVYPRVDLLGILGGRSPK